MNIRSHLLKGHAIPALPLALDKNRRFSEKHEKALVHYYLDAGCGALAVAVHSTQFEIREPEHGLFKPVLELASKTLDESLRGPERPFAKIAGVCGMTAQAMNEAETARQLGYHALLVSVAAWKNESEDKILEHCRTVSGVLPIIGFYLQSSVGGRALSQRFWRGFCEIENAVAIKVAPFNRYQTIDVARALCESGRDDIALYTGNDDNIVGDLTTRFRFSSRGGVTEQSFRGGLLGHWGVWTRAAVELFQKIRNSTKKGLFDAELPALSAAVTDMNAAVFDPANNFAGCIPGILEVLRRQGLVPTNLCLNPEETLSKGQAEELDRVIEAYPHLVDDVFVRENLDKWLS